jgi:hypothetical protein
VHIFHERTRRVRLLESVNQRYLAVELVETTVISETASLAGLAVFTDSAESRHRRALTSCRFSASGCTQRAQRHHSEQSGYRVKARESRKNLRRERHWGASLRRIRSILAGGCRSLPTAGPLTPWIIRNSRGVEFKVRNRTSGHFDENNSYNASSRDGTPFVGVSHGLRAPRPLAVRQKTGIGFADYAGF